MNRSIRRVAVACLALFLALLLNANYVQFIDAKKLRNSPSNGRVLLRTYSRERGPILVGGAFVAKSVPTNDRLKYLRTYPQGPEYAPATGYYSFVYGASGIEQAENSILSGEDDRLIGGRLSDLLRQRPPRGGAVVLTLNAKAQQAAWDGLKGKTGAVVALDPRTGAILALATSPSYDPALVSSHDADKNKAAWKRLTSDPTQPMLDRAISETYPPGSLFKVVTSATALSNGYTPTTEIPAPDALRLPLTKTSLHNFGGESCSPTGKMTLADALRISCNTAFAALGMSLGPDKLAHQAQAFGIGNDQLKIPMPVAQSVFPSDLNQPQTAQSAIGQYDVRLTPLQAAMIAAAVANHGTLMKPYLADKVLAPDLSVLDQTSPDTLSHAVSSQVADELTQMMLGVVAHGTGTAAQIPGVQVAGKTGTAQHAKGAPPHAWFIAFAPAQDPVVAVAVVIENAGGNGSDATGGRVAAPIARSVMQAVLGQ